MKIQRRIVTSDWHRPFHDKTCEGIFFQVLKHNTFDVCHFLGDLSDCFVISTFIKEIERDNRAKDEFKDTVKFLLDTQATNRRMKIILHKGNHEKRLDKIQDREFGMGRFLGKETFYGGIMTIRDRNGVGHPRKGLNLAWASNKPRYLLAPGFFLIHGDPKLDGSACSVWSGYSEKLTMDRLMCSGLMGHNHRMGLHQRADKYIASIGCMCEPDQSYNAIGSWQHGFAVVYHAGKWVYVQLLPIIGGKLVYDGYVYTATGREKI